MAIKKRSTSSVQEFSNGSSIMTTTSSTPLLSRSLLTDYETSLKEVPWQTDNEYVLTGYRRQIRSVKGCLWSAIAYLHNETVNIHTHSLAALFFLILLPLHFIPTYFPFTSLPKIHGDPLPIPPTLPDKLALSIYLICAVGCLGLSSWFHTIQCHSQERCDSAHRGDYIGIVILIVGSIMPGMYYSFYGQLSLQILYIGGILTAGIASAYIVLSPHHRSHRWHRTLTFIALGLTAVIPVIHVVVAHGLQYAREMMSLDLVVGSGASYIIGAVMYAARFPEHLSPGSFDHFGNSHQIFHCFVVLGAWLQYLALRGMVWGRSMAVGN